jgi:hypothetical protein
VAGPIGASCGEIGVLGLFGVGLAQERHQPLQWCELPLLRLINGLLS